MLAKVKDHRHFEDAYTFVTSSETNTELFNKLYPPEEGLGEEDLFDRVLRHSGDEGDQSVIEAVLELKEGEYFVTFHQDHPNDDGHYTVYEFEQD